MRNHVWRLLLIFTLTCTLEAQETHIHPIKKVRRWFNAEKELSSRNFHRFASLATTGPSGVPHVRIIEITGLSQKKGALFFTHKASRTVLDLKENPKAALNIWLPNTLRQATLNGMVMQISDQEAAKSWKRMSRSMQLMFLASDHGSVIESSEVLEKKKKALEKQFPYHVPMPDTFIGYRLLPDLITFYEMKPRRFPIKEIASLAEGDWVVYRVEP